MAQVPTIKVYRKADGKRIIINEVDFDQQKHSHHPMELKKNAGQDNKQDAGSDENIGSADAPDGQGATEQKEEKGESAKGNKYRSK